MPNASAAAHRPTIGIAAFHALPAIDPSRGGAIGGTETRAWTFARGLAVAGYDVRFVVRSDGDAFERAVEGVRVIGFRDRWFERYVTVGRAIAKTDRGWRLRRLSLRLLAALPLVLWHRAFRLTRQSPTDPTPFFDVNAADVWLTFGVQQTSAGVIAACRQNGRPCAVVLGCDADVDDWFERQPDRRNEYGDSGAVAAFILRNADGRLAQTPWQRDALRSRYGLASEVIRNPIDLDRWRPGDGGDFVLWIGRAEPIHKRPIEAIEIARLCPDLPFRIVMNPADPTTAAAVRARLPANVELVDFVPPREMPELMRAARLLLNTSSVEGFPNVFLQAAACEVPIVSQAVLGDWLRRSGAGVCGGGDRERTAAIVRELRDDASRRSQLGRSGRRFVEQHHALADRVAELAAFCKSLHPAGD